MNFKFYSSDFHQVAHFITLSVHTDGAGESPRCAIYSKIIHVLTEAFLGFPCVFPDSPISTISYTEFLHAPLPTPTQLHLSIFSTVVCLQNLPAHSLE